MDQSARFEEERDHRRPIRPARRVAVAAESSRVRAMSSEDLERYEAEIELQLYKEYKDVCPMFSFVVETERRFYLANEVHQQVRTEGDRTFVELELWSCVTPGCGTCTAPAASSSPSRW
jgi:hypothetical protein